MKSILLIFFLCFIDFNYSLKDKGLFNFIFSGNNCNCKCGIPNRFGRLDKLLGGEYLRSYEFPWLSIIQLRDIQTSPGVLINDRYVLTSATTVIGLTPLDVKVGLGQFDRCFPDQSSLNVSVESIIIHPSFTPGSRANDIALIKLSAPVQLSSKISPICLASQNNYVGQVATVAGWNEAQTVQGPIQASCRPRKLGLPVLGPTECLGTAGTPEFVSTDKGCIGVIGSPGVICSVDAGGPVMYRTPEGIYELIGILSDGNLCSVPSTAIYTNIYNHLQWIVNNTRDSCYCKRFFY